MIIIVILIITLIFLLSQVKEDFNDKICGKSFLNRISIWKNVKEKYGEKKALEIFPKTWILPDEIAEVPDNRELIAKKLWASFRRGILITNTNKNLEGYDLVQEFISNPMLINGYKFDIRFFIVEICGVATLLYEKGYNVYGKKKFNYRSNDKEEKINQSMTEDRFYDDNKLPRLFSQLDINHKITLNKIAQKLNVILSSTKDRCCKDDKGKINIFGLDVELLDNHEPIIIEINSAPFIAFDDKWKIDLISNMKKNVLKRDYRHFIRISP